MTHLRKIMLEELQRRHYSERERLPSDGFIERAHRHSSKHTPPPASDKALTSSAHSQEPGAEPGLLVHGPGNNVPRPVRTIRPAQSRERCAARSW